ncbi:MAG: hypothetical protein ACPGQS_08305 [Bradymonadia bacterium]
MKTEREQRKPKHRRAYEKPGFLSAVVFERNSLACVPTNLNTQPGPAPFGCSMQS